MKIFVGSFQCESNTFSAAKAGKDSFADGLVPQVQAISGYRTAPHTDYDEAETRAAVALMRILKDDDVVKSGMISGEAASSPLVRKELRGPNFEMLANGRDGYASREGSGARSHFVTSGEDAASPLCPLHTIPHFFRIRVQFADAAQTNVEPYVSIMKMVRELDADTDVISCSVFNGQPWVDAPCMSASVIVYSKANHETVHAKAKAIADYYETHKTDLKFGVPALAPDKTVEGVKPLAKPVFISDNRGNPRSLTTGDG